MAYRTVCRDRIVGKSPHRVQRPGIRVPIWAANPYRPELARLIPAFKDDSTWVLAWVLPHRLVMAMAAYRPLAGTFLVPVPSRSTTVRHRDIDHTWVLARRVARELGIGTTRPLRERDDGDAQRTQGHAGRQRLSGARFLAHTCRPPVILVDDVVTTGTSLAASCEALTRNGTTVIAAAVIGGADLVGKW